MWIGEICCRSNEAQYLCNIVKESRVEMKSYFPLGASKNTESLTHYIKFEGEQKESHSQNYESRTQQMNHHE